MQVSKLSDLATTSTITGTPSEILPAYYVQPVYTTQASATTPLQTCSPP
jgi:hypothetical protein